MTAKGRTDNSGIAAVVLAAGSSSRLGSPKQVLPFRGTSLLRRSVTAALDSGCSPVIVVTGAYADLSRRELEGLDVREVWNAHWETGMASSIRAGLEGLDPDLDAAIFLLCDQPHVTAGVLSGLADSYRATGKPVVASVYGGSDGSFGVPALFSRALFAELAALEGSAGAKQVIQRHASQAHLVPFPGGEVDVDTREDVSRLMETEGDLESRP